MTIGAELSHRTDEEQTTAAATSLRDKTCMVTGASRGIGRAIALNLGREGANVVVNYRSSETEASEVSDTIDTGGGHAVTVQADVGNKTAAQREPRDQLCIVSLCPGAL